MNFKRFLLCLTAVILFNSSRLFGQQVTLFSENFSSGSFTANGWTFPNGQGNWQVGSSNTPSGGVAPNAFFNWAVVTTNYSVALLSTTINATSITGPVSMDYLLLLNNYNTSTLEQFKVEYKTTGSSTWTLLTNYTNTLLALQDWSVSGAPLTGVSGTNFQIKFTAYGVNSFNIYRWSLDNILVKGISCPASIQALTVSATPTICAGGQATLNSSGGGISYTWSPLGGNSYSAVVSPTTTTTYALVSSIPGCTASPVTAVATVTVFTNPTTLTAASSSSVICSGNTLTLSASGASSYTWNPGTPGASITASPGVGTVYTVTSTNSLNCTNTATLLVSVNPTPTLSLFSTTASICSGSVASLIGSGANTYSWSNGASGGVINVSPPVSTSYTLFGYSAQGCVASSTISLQVLPGLTVVSTPTAVCSGNSATLSASGVQSYTWSTNSNSTSIVVSPNSSTSYSVSGTNSMGCISVQTLNLLINANPTVTAVSSATAVCNGNSVTISAGGASTYTWSTGAGSSSITQAPATNTTFIVSGTSSAGCTGSFNSATVSINVNPNPTLVVVNTPTGVCMGNTAVLSASGAATYSWNTGANTNSISVSPVTNTTYTVTGTSAQQCIAQLTLALLIKQNPTVTIIPSSTALCIGSTLSLLGGGAATYSWSSGSAVNLTTISPTLTTAYTLTGTAANGCSATNSILINVNPLPIILINASNTLSCAGETISLSASGAGSYTWSTGLGLNTILVSPSANTVYSVFGLDLNNCSNTKSVNITVIPGPSLSIGASLYSICVGETSTLTASGASSYTWTGFPAGSMITVSPLVNTAYTVIGSSSNGCKNTGIITLTVDACTAVNENVGPLGNRVYPNPSENVFNLSLNWAYTELKLEVFSVSGQLLKSETTISKNPIVDLSNLAPGVYFLRAYDGNHYDVFRLVRE